MSNTVLVLGFYKKGNLGDDLFEDAFKLLFPNFNFVFVNKLTANNLKNIDTVFIGGGSLLGEPLSISSDATDLLKYKKIFYIGVGSETNFHESHLPYMQLAKLIAPRTNVNYDKLLNINSNVLAIPDLAYCLKPSVTDKKISKSILVVPNILVVPKWNDPHWKHVAWQSFKVEFAQTLDLLLEEGYHINFFPMCSNPVQDDSNAATEILNCMSKKLNLLLPPAANFGEATNTFSQYEMVLTQRYHGAILSNMVNNHCVTIHHHDKLKTVDGVNVPYYGLFKDLLLEKINLSNNTPVLSIDRNIFKNLIKCVNDLI